MILLERDSQLKLIEHALGLTSAGDGVCVLLYGEAGVGKSSLVQALIEKHRDKFQVLTSSCEALFTPRPLGPLVDMAEQFPPSIASALHEGHTYNGLFPKLLAHLRQSGKPSLLVIEDMQWADESTLDFVRYLGRRLAGVPVALILTYRDDEISTAHPLRRVIGELSPARTSRVALSPLSRSAVAQLAGRTAQSIDRLYDITGGNPFFLTEVLATEGTALPPSVLDAVIARLARLSRPARELLDVCSVVPSRVELAIIDRILPDADIRIEECQAAGVLLYESPYLQFRHELGRQAVERAMPADQRLRWHRKVFDVLSDPASPIASLPRLVHHAALGRLSTELSLLAPKAAREAVASSSHKEAAALFQLAIEHSHKLAPAQRVALIEEAAQELRVTGRVKDSLQYFQQALALHEAAHDKQGQARCLRNLGYLTYREQGYLAESYAQLNAALALLLQPPINAAELSMTHSALTEVHSYNYNYAEAIAQGEQAIALAEKAQDPIALINALRAASSAKSALRYDPEAKAQFERALEIALSLHRDEDTAHIYMSLQSAAMIHREHLYALDIGKRGIAFCESRDMDAYLMRMLDRRAMSYVDLGRWADADAEIERCLSFPELSQRFRDTVEFLRMRQGARRGAADAQEYWKLLQQNLESLKIEYRLPAIATACAEAAWLRGDIAHALQLCQLTLKHVLINQDGRLTGPALVLLHRIGAELPKHWPEIAPPYAAELAGDIAKAAHEWELLSCPYERALALMHGDEAQVREALQTLDKLGAKPAAEIARQKLRALGAREVLRGPQSRTRSDPLGLTGREREVFDLLLQGESTAHIAARLHRSERTVEHHVASLYSKLNIRSRQELVARFQS